MADWLLVPIEDPDGCSGCFGCLVILAIASLFFGGSAAAGVSILNKRKRK